jgi:hypothetical protein
MLDYQLTVVNLNMCTWWLKFKKDGTLILFGKSKNSYTNSKQMKRLKVEKWDDTGLANVIEISYILIQPN